MTNDSQETFIDVVQEHERAWGTEGYPNRPTLAELLQSAIVAFWLPSEGKDRRQIATVHEDLNELNRYMMRLILHSRMEMPKYRLATIYVNQKKAAIRGVRLEIIGVDIDNK